MASGSTWSSNGGPSIRGSVWHSQVLKVLDRYLSNIQIWRAVRLASVAENGRAVGGLVRMGQEQSHSSSRALAAAELTDMGCCVADPIRGKSLGIIHSIVQASDSSMHFCTSVT